MALEAYPHTVATGACPACRTNSSQHTVLHRTAGRVHSIPCITSVAAWKADQGYHYTCRTHVFRQVLAHVMRTLRLQCGVESAFRRLEHFFGSLAVLPRPSIDYPTGGLSVFNGIPIRVYIYMSRRKIDQHAQH